MAGATTLLRSPRRISRFALPSSSSCSFSSVSAPRNHRHRPIPDVPTAPSLLRSHIILLPSSSHPHVTTHFRCLSSRAVPASSDTPPSECPEVKDEVLDKLGFEKVTEEFIGECKSKALLFRHKKTGAQVISMSNDDEQKVFSIIFRNPLKDSTGISQILQRSVYCGSRKYPVKNPFEEVIGGTLGNFSEKFIYSDRTCYVVTSAHTKDFYNLVDMNLDAVFFPKCVEDLQIFRQEGWHFELNDPSGDISYKGAVFNQMKKYYSQPEPISILKKTTRQAIFPETTYGFDCAGDPKVIPQLSFKEFKEFHRKYYHPSNARIWFYGDDDPTERLRILSEYLDMFDASSAPNESRIKPQKLFSEPVRIFKKYPSIPFADLKKKNMVCLSWLLCDGPLDMETERTIQVLLHLMSGTIFSPLKRILLENGFVDVFIEVSVDLLQPLFSVGVMSVSHDDILKVEELVMSTLKKLAKGGFHSDTLEVSLNGMEFNLREYNDEPYTRGVSLLVRSMDKWIFDMDPFEPLKYGTFLTALKSRIQKEGSKAVFSPLIEKFILHNPHRVVVEMQPDPQKASRAEKAEKEILGKVKASLTDKDLAGLVRATQELRLKQSTPDPPEAMRSVPSLSLQDIPKEPTTVPKEVDYINGVKVLQHDLFTNDVLYTDIVFDMSSVKQELIPLVPLFCYALQNMNTKDTCFVGLRHLTLRKTGGISIESMIRCTEDPCCHIIVRGKAMAKRAEDLFRLINYLLQEVQFTDHRWLKRLVSHAIVQYQQSAELKGQNIIALRMDAKLNVFGWIREQMCGISHLEFLRALEKKVDQDWERISSSLEEIRKSLFTRKGCIINMTAEGKNLTKSEQFVGKFLDLLPGNPPCATTTWNARLPCVNEAILIPTPVNHVGKSVNIDNTGYRVNGRTDVISTFLVCARTWLPDRTVISGAVYATYRSDNYLGACSFLPSGDTNLLKTLDRYDNTGDFLRQLEMDNDTLKMAIIQALKNDSCKYLDPKAKGYNSLEQYLTGVTEEDRKRRHEEMLSTSLKDFKEFADAFDAVKDKGVVVALGAPNDVHAALKERPDFFQVKTPFTRAEF
ncbi:PREDICTED: presequence protease 1, chloroplastic/mitochondrial-like [Prunus mume]|uniref:Presequence protease 1, chloroplastic/mitochondrial-like n=1 Tax=Prunus mume TaxID=102107 RepID=A0ABM0PA46_PRUMU|nr:PREDICTED: presequence protease 1, chloroplastic/mitochondrial-like [Prunus mume]